VTTQEPPTTGASLPRKIVAGLIGLLGLASLSFAATSGWLTPQYARSTEAIARAICLAVAVASACVALLVLMRLKPSQTQPAPIYQPDIDWLARLQEEISAPSFEYRAGPLIAFIELITSPAEYRSRVAETIDLEGRGIHKRVSVEFVLPDSDLDNEYFYLPVLQPGKGDLVDNFRLIDGSGSSLTNMSYLETVELAAIGLRALLIIAAGMQYSQWTTRTRTAELILLELIARRGPSPARSIRRSIKRGLKLLEGRASRDTKDLIRTYLSSLSTSYPIVAVVPKSLIVMNRVLLRYEQTIMPSSQSVGLSGKVRIGIGVRPSQVILPLDLAMTASSYHLRINGPAEKYVVEQILRCADCRQRVQRAGQRTQTVSCVHAQGNGDPPDSHFHLRGRFGQNFTHLYMRGYASQAYKDTRFEILVRFNETPPGSRAVAAVTALTALIFIWVIGHLASNHEIISNSDLPAVLLALPAVAASWFGLAAGSEALVGSSLHARLSLMFSGILSVASVVVYLLQDASMAVTSKQPVRAGHMSNLAGVSNPEWMGLLVAAFLGLVYISWHLLARIRNYMRLISRSDPLTENHSIM
jgi:hypothetical protein